MDAEEFARECSAFDEKISLAALEASKAQNRVMELEYMKSRFLLDYHAARARDRQATSKPCERPPSDLSDPQMGEI